MYRLTEEESRLFQGREELLTPIELRLVQDTMDALDFDMRALSLTPKGDDRAARLEAALVRFMLDCRQT